VLGFKGVAITDAPYMDGISATHTCTQASIMAIEAGNDMITPPWLPSTAQSIITVMKAELQNGKVTQQQVDASVTRILALKIRYNIVSGVSASAMPTTTPPVPPSTCKTPTATNGASCKVLCGCERNHPGNRRV
jgi:beta-N-acetylhexosaminidase